MDICNDSIDATDTQDRNAPPELDLSIFTYILDELNAQMMQGDRRAYRALQACAAASKLLLLHCRRFLYRHVTLYPNDAAQVSGFLNMVRFRPDISNNIRYLEIWSRPFQCGWINDPATVNGVSLILLKLSESLIGLYLRIHCNYQHDPNLRDTLEGAIGVCLLSGRLTKLKIIGLRLFSLRFLNLPKRLSYLELNGVTLRLDTYLPMELYTVGESQRYAPHRLALVGSSISTVLAVVEEEKYRNQTVLDFDKVSSLKLRLSIRSLHCAQAFKLLELMGQGDGSELTELTLEVEGGVSFAFITCVRYPGLTEYQRHSLVTLAPCTKLRRLSCWIHFSFDASTEPSTPYEPVDDSDSESEAGSDDEDWELQRQYEFYIHDQILVAWVSLLQTAHTTVEYLKLDLDNFLSRSVQLYDNLGSHHYQDDYAGHAWRELDRLLADEAAWASLREVEIVIHLPEGSDCSSCSESDCGNGSLGQYRGLPDWEHMVDDIGTASFDEDACVLVASHLKLTMARLGVENVRISSIVSAN